MKIQVKIFNLKDKLHRKFLYLYLHIYNSFGFCQPKK